MRNKKRNLPAWFGWVVFVGLFLLFWNQTFLSLCRDPFARGNDDRQDEETPSTPDFFPSSSAVTTKETHRFHLCFSFPLQYTPFPKERTNLKPWIYQKIPKKKIRSHCRRRDDTNERIQTKKRRYILLLDLLWREKVCAIGAAISP